MDRISTRTLRFVPVILLIIYFGAVDRLDLFDAELKQLILFVMIVISAVAAVVIFLRKELQTNRAVVMLSFVLFSAAIWIYYYL